MTASTSIDRRWLHLAAAAIAILAAVPAGAQPGQAAETSAFRELARRSTPVVVSITATGPRQASADVAAWFSRFLGELPTEPRVERTAGSGFVISRGGEIITNYHVVAGATRIEVGLYGDNRRTHAAVVVAGDPVSDTALIRLVDPPADLVAAALGDSDAAAPGDWVMAIGNPLRLGHTVSVGVISYIGRVIGVDDGLPQALIQTDAAIHSGSSGGPLFDMNGRVIGMTWAMAASEELGAAGIGFALPINAVTALLPQLRAGKVVRGRIGVRLLPGRLTADEALTLRLPAAAGALIAAVEPGSPADRAGLQPGDAVLVFDGCPIDGPEDLLPRLMSATPGRAVPLRIGRAGATLTLNVTAEQLDEPATEATPAPATARDAGLVFAEPGDENTAVFPAAVEGAPVRAVEFESAAWAAGVVAGDILVSVNQHRVRSVGEARRALAQVAATQSAFLLVLRDGERLFVRLPAD